MSGVRNFIHNLYFNLLEGMILLDDKEKMIKAKEILQKIANGINPINGQSINDESFLNDPRIIRCFFYVSEVGRT